MSLLDHAIALRALIEQRHSVAVVANSVDRDRRDIISDCRGRMPICRTDATSLHQADKAPASRCGGVFDELVLGQVAAWRQRLGDLPMVSDHWFYRLRVDCLISLQTPWMHEAIALGWTDAELFGLSVHAPKICVEAMGLVVGIAASRLQPPLSVVAVTESYAQIATGTGARLMHRRHRPSVGGPIWEHSAYQVSDIR